MFDFWPQRFFFGLVWLFCLYFLYSKMFCSVLLWSIREKLFFWSSILLLNHLNWSKRVKGWGWGYWTCKKFCEGDWGESLDEGSDTLNQWFQTFFPQIFSFLLPSQPVLPNPSQLSISSQDVFNFYLFIKIK